MIAVVTGSLWYSPVVSINVQLHVQHLYIDHCFIPWTIVPEWQR